MKTSPLGIAKMHANQFAGLILLSFIILLFTGSAYAISLSDTRHLLTRTGFPPSFAETAPYLKLNKQESIKKILNSIRPASQTPMPGQFRLPYTRKINFKTATRQQKQTYRKELRKQMQTLKAWWINEMIVTSSPFSENLTLFWHNHFVSSATKIRHPALMANQNQTLRRLGATNFRSLLFAMLKDPALLQYLDNQKNRKNRTNENLARELLELFTLGEGHYSESDIKQTAKILTGHRFNPKTGEYFSIRQHDNTLKTVFNQTGNWNLADLVDIILDNSQTARFITQKLWNHYITTPISNDTLQQFSSAFYQNYEITPLIEKILQHPQFWSSQNQGTQIKDPIKLIVGLYRQFELQPDTIEQLSRYSARMGQDIFNPPNVKGWKTGVDWINTHTLIQRQNFLQNALRGMKIKLKALANTQNNQAWLDLLLPSPLQAEMTLQDDLWQNINTILTDERYQLE